MFDDQKRDFAKLLDQYHSIRTITPANLIKMLLYQRICGSVELLSF